MEHLAEYSPETRFSKKGELLRFTFYFCAFRTLFELAQAKKSEL